MSSVVSVLWDVIQLIVLSIVFVALLSAVVGWLAFVWVWVTRMTKQYQLSKAILEEQEAQKELELAKGATTQYLEDPSA